MIIHNCEFLAQILKDNIRRNCWFFYEIKMIINNCEFFGNLKIKEKTHVND